MVLEELCRLVPQAPIYTLVYKPSAFNSSPISQHQVHTSLVDKLPFARDHHRLYIPLMPLATQLFDLSQYDLILSSSAAFAHGVRTHRHQLHISYVHSPMRYAWHQYSQHANELGYGGLPVRLLLSGLRSWDRRVAKRADAMLANSRWTAGLIRRAFGRESIVIYPPVHVERFSPATKRENYYLTVSRLVPYKRVDLIVRAFNELGLPLIVAGDGLEQKALHKKAALNIQFLHAQSDAQIAQLMGSAKAFVYAAEEDFGIAPVEAQAAGCPVIGYRSGGLLETVVEGETGIFFDQQNGEAICQAVHRFETSAEFSVKKIRKNAERFSAGIFRENFSNFVEEAWSKFELGHRIS